MAIIVSYFGLNSKEISSLEELCDTYKSDVNLILATIDGIITKINCYCVNKKEHVTRKGQLKI